MVNIPLGTSDWQRRLSDEPNVLMRNRYFEQNPTNLTTQVALLARPGVQRIIEVGTGPIRALYSQSGTFGEALFVVSGEDLYRVDVDETVTAIATGVFTNEMSSPSMAATGNIGSVPEYLYICEGAELYMYVEDGFATGFFQATGALSSGNQVRIGTVYYQFTSGSVNAGTPAGTSGNPWLVAMGGSTADGVGNLFNAINASGVAGTAYSTALVIHPDVTATAYTASDIAVRAKVNGLIGNGIVTTETGANTSWGAGTLTGGGSGSFTQVNVPDDVGVISVGYVASYVICVIAQGYGVNGRFYWIEPGEDTIDPINFATAERAPDALHSVRVVGDQFWLLGTNSTEVWIPTGNADTPFQRVQGRVFDRGIWGGTDVQVKDVIILVDNDGVVYEISSGPKRISDHSIEERIRRAIVAQRISEGI